MQWVTPATICDYGASRTCSDDEEQEALGCHRSSCHGATSLALSSAKGYQALDCYAAWHQEPLPEDSRRLNLEDVAIEVQTEDGGIPKLKPTKKSPTHKCSLHMSASVSWKPPDADHARMRKFMFTSYAGIELGVGMGSGLWPSSLVQ